MPAVPQVSAPPRQFRLDIEGLRAVAALLVAAYHVWFGRVSGGVDVFFVIAGFMVTTTLLRHLDRTGRIDIGRYLGRLLVRLLPNALVVLAVVALASWWLVPITRQDEVYAQITASALYYENWELASRSVDYLNRGFTSSPVQHFWAMSIQGQFYLIWLALFVIMLALASARPRRAIGVVMAVVVAGSFVFSVAFTAMQQSVAYFHTGARVWEFGVGGLLALSLAWWPTLSRRASFALGWLGLLAIVSCGAVLSVGTSFPGWIALWPVTGAALILVAGTHDSRWSASALLSSRPLVSLGSVSYALYLWHWPLLVFLLLLTDRDEVGPLLGLAIIVVAIILSFLSTHFVERPVRSIRWDRRRAWSVPLLAVLIVGPFAGITYAVSGTAVQGIPTTTASQNSHSYPGAEALDTEANATASSAQTLTSANTEDPAPGLAAAPDDIPEVYDAGCHQQPLVDEVAWCEYGDPDAGRTMILTGGSHSAHWQPALEVLAKQQGWRLLSATKSGCRPGTHLVSAASQDPSVNRDPAADEAWRTSCRAWNANIVTWIGQQNPDLVVLTSTVVERANSVEQIPQAYPVMWQTLSDDDTRVLAIRDTPRPGRDVPDCLANNGPTSRKCDVPLGVLGQADPTGELQTDSSIVDFVDLTAHLCAGDSCPAVIGNVVVYSDNSHLTRTFSRSLAPALLDAAPQLR
ncbi:MAG: acyltransferase family protein [Ornithinimicrobium sp.]